MRAVAFSVITFLGSIGFGRIDQPGQEFRWNILLEACLSENTHIVYCDDLIKSKRYIEEEVNRLLVQNLTGFEKYLTTAAYYAITQKVIFSWKIDSKNHLNITYDVSKRETQTVTFSYSF